MVAFVRMFDETTNGAKTPALTLELDVEHITIREVIRRRVCAEVEAYNTGADRIVFRGLVTPTDAEATANGFRMPNRRQVDPDAQVKIALEAFERNGFFVLFQNRQVEDLDEVLELLQDNDVSFIRLVPLVGG